MLFRSIAGIVVGSLIAPVLVGVLGLNGSLAACGAVALGYALQLLARPRYAPVPAAHAGSALAGS